jgi:hypothetical protein
MEFDEIYGVVCTLYQWLLPHTPIHKFPKNVTDKFLMCEQRQRHYINAEITLTNRS